VVAAQERVGLDDRVRRQLVEPQQQRAAGGRLRRPCRQSAATWAAELKRQRAGI